MKRLAVLLLTALLFFNWCGYRLLTSYWEQQAAHRLQARLDHDEYDASSLISIKLPVRDLAYFNNSCLFERVEGEVIISDIAYKYVKRRIVNDSLEFLCIRNTEAMEIQKAGSEYGRKVNDFPNSKPAPHNDFQKVYSPENLHLTIEAPGSIVLTLSKFISHSLAAGHTRTAERPPAIAIA